MASKRYVLGFAFLKSMALCALAMALFAMPIHAQKGGGAPGRTGGTGGSGSPGGSRGTTGGGTTTSRTIDPPYQPGTRLDTETVGLMPEMQPLPKPSVVEDDACLPWELSDARNSTVSAIRLGVPGKARSQYEKACGAFKSKKMNEAELHVRDAIQKYPKYPAAWVMLGQVLQDQQKLDEAHDACSQPLVTDPTYLPPYLCLAGLLNQEKKWDDLLAWSDRFAGMSLTGDMYANYYRALALLNLGHLPEAQKSALKCEALDTQHHQPAFYFLLAEIYGAQGNLADATRQINQVIKLSKSKQDKDAAKEYLSQLQSRQNQK